jgi:phosphoribosylglycinamide formyltransferase 1
MSLANFTNMKNIVIFSSGEGSNTEKIIEKFSKSKSARVSWIVCNNENAGVIKIAEKYKKGLQLISKSNLEKNAVQLAEFLKVEKTDLIVLAGFLLKIPNEIIKAFPDSIINLHPSLLPKFGGKGMYGMNVHRAVVDARELESGITIHLVNEEYDKGKIIFQKKIAVTYTDNAESLSTKIKEMEHIHFPETILKIVEN